MGQRFLDDFTEATRWVMFVRDIVVDGKWFFTQVCLAIDKFCYLNNTKPTAHSCSIFHGGLPQYMLWVSDCSSAEVSAFYIVFFLVRSVVSGALSVHLEASLKGAPVCRIPSSRDKPKT
jgi:hypothetical protein